MLGWFLVAAGGEMRSNYFQNRAPVRKSQRFVGRLRRQRFACLNWCGSNHILEKQMNFNLIRQGRNNNLGINKHMTNKKHYPLIRTIYLYLFTLLGLALLTIGGVRFVDMGLKAFVFTKAQEEERLIYQQVPIPYSVPSIERLQQEIKEGKEACLSEKEKINIEYWLADYKDWKERRSKIDPVTARRHRDASLNLAMILIGLPLYLYHWRIIKKETKNKEEREE